MEKVKDENKFNINVEIPKNDNDYQNKINKPKKSNSFVLNKSKSLK